MNQALRTGSRLEASLKLDASYPWGSSVAFGGFPKSKTFYKYLAIGAFMRQEGRLDYSLVSLQW